MAHHAFVILLLVVASATVLSAQTVVDPRYVEFTPSADHSALASDGTPLVQRYSLSIFPSARRSLPLRRTSASRRRAEGSSASTFSSCCRVSRRASSSKRALRL